MALFQLINYHVYVSYQIFYGNKMIVIIIAAK